MNSFSNLPQAERNRIKFVQLMREHVHALPLLIPPAALFEVALEYGGTARFVALYYVPDSGEARYDDGRPDERSSRAGFLTWCSHSAIAPLLQRYPIQLPYGSATWAIVLDRRDRIAYVVRYSLAVQLVNAQDHADSVDAAWVRPTKSIKGNLTLPSLSLLHIDYDEQAAHCTDLQRWLDNWLRPPVTATANTTPQFVLVDDVLGLRVFWEKIEVSAVYAATNRPPLIVVRPAFMHMQADIEQAVAAYLHRRQPEQ